MIAPIPLHKKKKSIFFRGNSSSSFGYCWIEDRKACWWEGFVLSPLEKFVGGVCTLCVLLHIIKSRPIVRLYASPGCEGEKGGGGRGRNVGKRKRISGMAATIYAMSPVWNSKLMSVWSLRVAGGRCNAG